MNFSNFNEFKRNQGSGINDVVSYLTFELASIIKELRVGLKKISFQDNFETFIGDFDIPALSELPIANRISGAIPEYWIILRKNEGGIYVCEGDTAWSLDYLYLKNTHASLSASITVAFFR